MNKGRALPGQCRAQDVGLGAFAGMQQGQLPKCFSARLKMLLRPHISCYEHGKHLASFHAGPDIWAQGCLSVLARGMKLGWFSAETKMWVQKYLSQTCRMAGWSLVRVSTETRLRRICRGGRRAHPNLVQCSDQEGGLAVFARVLHKAWTQAGSVPVLRCRFNSVC